MSSCDVLDPNVRRSAVINAGSACAAARASAKAARDM